MLGKGNKALEGTAKIIGIIEILKKMLYDMIQSIRGCRGICGHRVYIQTL